MKTKCNFKELIVLVALLFSALFSNMKAQNGVCGDNLTWSFNSETGELTITGTGEMYDYYYFTAPWSPYKANIEKLNIGNGITYIGKYSFNGLMNIQEVTIPNTVEIIGNDSFDNCGSLRIVNIPPSVKKIENAAFGSYAYKHLDEVNIQDLEAWLIINFVSPSSNPAGISKSFKLNGEELTTIVIPEHITELKEFVFYNCSNIENFTTNGQVNGIHDSSLIGTKWYNNQSDGVIYFDKVLYDYKGEMPVSTQIVVKDGIETIAKEAFKNEEVLEAITLPNTLKTIEQSAFMSCSGLKMIEFPESLQHIASLAFCGCTSLEGINIPSSIEIIEESAFAECPNLQNIIVNEGNNYYDSRNNCNAIVETLTNKLIRGCLNTIIPENVEVLGESAFSKCIGLKTIKIPNSVKKFEDKVFSKCVDLESIELSDSLEDMGMHTFSHCSNLKKCVIPNRITAIGGGMFNYCTSLEKVFLPNTIKKVGDWSFTQCNSLKSIDLPNELDSIGAYAFSSCISLNSVIIPNSVKVVEEYAFNYCKGLKEVTIGKHVINIGEGVFRECDSLVVVNSHMEDPKPINQNTFKNYEGVVLNVPIGTKDKYRYTSYWSNFTNICESFGEADVVEMGSNGLIYLVYKSQGVAVVKSSYTSTENLIIPDEIKLDGSWCKVTGIHTQAFLNNNSLSSLTLGKNVKSIGDSAFSGCKKLSKITFNDELQYIGESSFTSTAISELNLPDSVQYIGGLAFGFCSNLVDININKNIKLIGERVFNKTLWYNNQSDGLIYKDDILLAYKGEKIFDDVVEVREGTRIIAGKVFSNSYYTRIGLPNSLEYICRGAFYNCSSLETINIPDNVEMIDTVAFKECRFLNSKIKITKAHVMASAFYECENLTEVEFGEEVKFLGINAFYGCRQMKAIMCYAWNPPICGENTFGEINKETCKLYVPDGTLELYRNADVWKDFVNILEISSLGVEDLVEDDTPIEYYELNGIKVNNPSNGVFIMKQGTKANKVIVK